MGIQILRDFSDKSVQNQPPVLPVDHFPEIDCQDYRIVIVTQMVIAIIADLFNQILELVLSNPEAFRLRLLANRPENSLVETLYFLELEKLVIQVGSVAAKGFLESVDKTAVKFERLVTHAEEVAASIKGKLLEHSAFDELLNEADELYRDCMNRFNELKKLPRTDIQRALYSGRLTTIFRELDDVFSNKKGEMMHRYCGCHIESLHSAEELKPLAPTLEGNFSRNTYNKFRVSQPVVAVQHGMVEYPSVTLLSQSFGGGHNVVQHAMSQRLAEQSGHAYRIEADEEVLEPYYQFKRWTGRSGTEWSQYLLQGNYFRTIRFLGWLSSGEHESASLQGQVNLFALSMLARGRQDLAMMLFTRHAKAAEEAADHLGMGLADIATDLDFDVFSFGNGAKNPHFKHVLMARDPALEENGPLRNLKPHQIVEGGFPVREPFLKKYTSEELLDIRKRYKEKYNLADDARVVVLLCGGEGVQNQCAEMLAKHYSAKPNAPKIHLFAINGNNTKKKEELDTIFNSLRSETIQGSSLGWTSDIELGELYAMATFEAQKGLLISAKAGGGTISEAIARGIQFLVCDQTKVIKHEKRNLEFCAERNLGTVFSHAAELPRKTVEMLTHPLEPRPAPDGISYSDFDSKAKSMRIVSDLIRECHQDRAFQEKQENVFKKLPPASL